jgi:hypothetical protein
LKHGWSNPYSKLHIASEIRERIPHPSLIRDT